SNLITRLLFCDYRFYSFGILTAAKILLQVSQSMEKILLQVSQSMENLLLQDVLQTSSSNLFHRRRIGLTSCSLARDSSLLEELPLILLQMTTARSGEMMEVLPECLL